MIFDLSSLKLYFFGESISHSHSNTPFHLYCSTFGVNAESHILGTGHTNNLYMSGIFIHLHFSDMSYPGSGICPTGNSITPATRIPSASHWRLRALNLPARRSRYGTPPCNRELCVFPASS